MEMDSENNVYQTSDTRADVDDINFDVVNLDNNEVDHNWVSLDSADDFMPLWLPLPVLTAEETEVYVDRSLKYLYETVPIPEHLLPPIYYRKEKKKLRLDHAVSDSVSKNSTNVRIRSRYRDSLSQGTLSVAALEPPKSLFDRPSPVVAKLRQDMRLQKYRGLSRSTVANVPGMKPYFPSSKGNVDPEFVPEWLIHEDYALLQAIQQIQELPLNLTIMYPGHVPNWDLVSELVNQISRIHRSPAQCKNRFEAAILPREEGKLTSDTLSKKQKKLKGMNQLMSHSKYTRNYKTAQLYLQDSNNTFSQMMNSRFDAIRCVSNRRAPTIKRLPLTTSTKNPKHAQLLIECEIDYDNPLTPVQIATRRAQRLAKEKQTQLATHEQLLVRNVHQQQVNKQQQQQQQQTSQQQVTVTTATTAQVAQPIIVQQLQPQQIQTQQLVSPKTIPISGANIVQQGQTAVVVSISQNSAITTASPVQIRNYVHRPVEMIVTSGNQQQTQPTSIVITQAKPVTTMATANLISPTTIQRIIPITQISTTGTVSTTPRIVTASGKPASQVQLYKQQQTVQHQVKILHPRTKTPVLPTSVVVGSAQQQRHQVVSPQQPQQHPQQQRQLQLKPVTGTLTPAAGRISEADLAAYLKKQKLQQQQKMSAATVIATSNATNTVQAQFVPTTQAVITQANKSTVGVTIPTVIPTIKTSTIGASNLKSTSIATPPIRQFTIQQQLQQRKLQRVTPIGQVMVNVTQSGQGLSQVLTKGGAQGNVTTTQQLVNARVIPVVVSASALRAATNVPNVTIDATGMRHTQQTLPSNTIKISGSPVSVTTLSQQQHLLSQLVQNQSLVRQGNLKLSNAGLVATTISTTTGGAAASPSSAQIVSIPNIQTQITPSEKKPL